MVDEYSRQAIIITNFFVVKCHSAFYAVLRRSALKKLKAVTSIYHLTIEVSDSRHWHVERKLRSHKRMLLQYHKISFEDKEGHDDVVMTR